MSVAAYCVSVFDVFRAQRLNSLFEPNPTLSVTEDILIGPGGSSDVPILRGFQVFASVHRASPAQQLKLSPATRSRFTEITVNLYSDDELRTVLRSELTRMLPRDGGAVDQICTVLFSAYELAITANLQSGKPMALDSRALLRCVDFISRHR